MSGAQRPQLVGTEMGITVQLGRTEPTFVHGPRREVEVKIWMPDPVEKTKYFFEAELYQIAGSRTTTVPQRTWIR